MIDYINANQGYFWLIAGFALLIIEVLALGLGTSVLLFPALGALLTGSLVWLGMLPTGWLYGIAAFAMSTALVTAVSWQPLKRLQAGPGSHRETSSDLIGLRFRLDEPVSRAAIGQYRYSGITWRVELDDESDVDNLPAGAQVEVSGVDAGIFRIVRQRSD